MTDISDKSTPNKLSSEGEEKREPKAPLRLVSEPAPDVNDSQVNKQDVKYATPLLNCCQKKDLEKILLLIDNVFGKSEKEIYVDEAPKPKVINITNAIKQNYGKIVFSEADFIILIILLIWQE